MIRRNLRLFRVPREAEEPFRAYGGGETRPPPLRDRQTHASSLLQALDAIDAALPPTTQRAPDSEGTLLAARGTADLDATATRLADVRSRAVVVAAEGDVALVHFRTDAHALRHKIEQYRDLTTTTGQPRNAPLIARIDDLRLPTLADLSLGEIDDDTIDPAQAYWVELWARGGRSESETERTRIAQEVLWFARLGGYRPSPAHFMGTERDIYLAQVSGEALLAMSSLVPEIYEVHLAPRVRLVEALLARHSGHPETRVDAPPPDASVVAVHDTGTSPDHPHLRDAVIGVRSVVPGEPGVVDRHGHGTAMSGMAVYREYLEEVVAGRLRARSYFAGIRLIPTPTQGPAGDDPELWAERTEEAITVAEELAGDRRVVHSLSVGAENPRAQRTAWSIAVDQLAWNDGAGRLLVVAGGNVPSELLAVEPDDYPVLNLGTPLCQPAQAWNAVTVGGYTALAGPAAPGTGTYPDPLAPAGGLSPYAATDVGGARPIKPDVVEEAGNTAPGGGLPNCGGEHLSPWTTSHRYATGQMDRTTWATSPAAATAAGALAELARMQSHLSPVALRALYIHSARWTQAMEAQFPDMRDRLRAVGYGLPARRRYRGADSNRPIFVHEGQLAPSQHDSEGRLVRPIQFIRVPLPEPLLTSLGETLVRLTVTLSYFVEPTERLVGRQYAGGRLQWEMQGPTETAEQLRARVNKLSRSSNTGGRSTGYSWTLGRAVRGRGSLQQDHTDIVASQVPGDRLVAIYPTLGWWDGNDRTRPREIPFALVVSLDLGDVDVDLYAAVLAHAANVVIT